MSNAYAAHTQWPNVPQFEPAQQPRVQLERELYDELDADLQTSNPFIHGSNPTMPPSHYSSNEFNTNFTSDSTLPTFPNALSSQQLGHSSNNTSPSAGFQREQTLYSSSTDPVIGATRFPRTYYRPAPPFDVPEQQHYQNTAPPPPTFNFQDPMQGGAASGILTNPSSPSYLNAHPSPSAYSDVSGFSGEQIMVSPPRSGHNQLDSQTPFRQHHPSQQQPSSSSLSRNPSGSRPSLRNQPPQAKRQRVQVQVEDDQDGADKEENKSKPPGACARCKTLKVKCEFRTDSEPCRRCLNGGYDCVIPGRKKRRTPPKREHLLNQIHDQAAKINQLMQQLETLQAQTGSSPSYSGAPLTSPDLSSPALSPTTTSTPALSYLGTPSISEGHLNTNGETSKDVTDWLAKAKASLSQFDGIIGGMGGMGMQKKYLIGEGNGSGDENGSDDGWYTGEEDVYEPVDEDDLDSDMDNDAPRLVKKPSRDPLSPSSNSSQGKKSSSSTNANKPVTLPIEASAIGLMANMSLRKNRNPSEGDGNNVGVASASFFRLSPAPESEAARSLNSSQPQAPHILTRRVITPDQAEHLFTKYYDHMNASLSLLDPILYSAQNTCLRSPFLFTVICAIASRYVTEQRDLYPRLMHYAQLAAGTALISGTKNIELCQAYILLSLYPVPAQRWDEDRSWLYLGLAIRVASDLNLSQPNTAKPLNETHAREMLNRTRVWLNCFNLDRSTGSQHGKTPIIKNTDYIACHSEDWWHSSPYNMVDFDVHLCAYNAELRIMADFVGKVYSDPKHPTGLNKDVDLEQLAMDTDDALSNLGKKWFPIANSSGTPQAAFRTGLLTLAYSYARLIALSYGFQYAFGKYKSDENPFLLRCLQAATDVVKSYIDNVAIPSQYNYILHGPEAQSVFVTFASAFLIKLLQPKFASYFTKAQRIEIRGLVRQVITALSAPEIVIDDRHAPKLYALFLKGLLETPMARVESQSPPELKQTSNLPQRQQQQQQSQQQNQTSPVLLSPITAAFGGDVRSQGSSQSFYFDQQQGANTSNHNNTQEMDFMSGFTSSFEPPIQFESEMLMQSMQSMPDSSLWNEFSTLPGLSWMNNFTADTPSNSHLFGTSAQQQVLMVDH